MTQFAAQQIEMTSPQIEGKSFGSVQLEVCRPDGLTFFIAGSDLSMDHSGTCYVASFWVDMPGLWQTGWHGFRSDGPVQQDFVAGVSPDASDVLDLTPAG